MELSFLFGHADAPDAIYQRLESAVEQVYTEHGVKQFYVGSYGAFDRMAATAIKAVKQSIAISNYSL